MVPAGPESAVLRAVARGGIAVCASGVEGIDAAFSAGLRDSALRDTEIGGFAVRKDDIVFVSQWLLHRDPRFFEDPLRFDPDRFLPEREARIPRFGCFPFGGGRRICIGNHLALAEGQIILNTIAQRFTMELVSRRPVRFQPLITQRPKGGIRVRFRAAAGG